jgi:hypothetical protein
MRLITRICSCLAALMTLGLGHFGMALARDIGEEHNVAAQNPAVIQKIDAICREAHTPERVFEPADREGVTDYVR